LTDLYTLIKTGFW